MARDLRNKTTGEVANRTIVPVRKGGTLRTGKQDIPLNRAYQRFGHAKVMQNFANRYLNEGRTSRMFGRNPKVSSSGDLPVIPPKLEEIFNNFPTEPTSEQKVWITRFVLRLASAGIWQELDHFNYFTNSGGWPEENALTDWKAGRTAIANNAPVLGADGYSFNGTTQYIDSAFNPSIDGVNYQLSSALAAAYLTNVNPDTSDFRMAFGVFSSPDNTATHLYNAQTSGVLTYAINRALNSSINGETLKSGILYSLDRPSSDTIVFANGSKLDTNTGAAIAMPPATFFVGARNNVGSAFGYFNGKITTFLAGGSLTDEQHTILYNELIELMINWGVFADPVIARYTGLTAQEETAIRDFVNAEVRSGNWFKINEFYVLGLNTPANALIGLKGRTAVTANVEHIPEVGYGFAGAGDIAIVSQVAPADLPQDDAQYGVYQRTTRGDVDTATLFGARVSNLDQTRAVIAGTAINYVVNDGSSEQPRNVENAYYNFARFAAAEQRHFINGVEEGNSVSPSVAPLATTLSIGAQHNEGGSINTNPYGGIISTWMQSLAVGFNYAVHYNHVAELLVNLTTFSTEEQNAFDANPAITDRDKLVVHDIYNDWIGRMTTPTATEQQAIADYLVAEQLAGNLELMDEFFLLNLGATNSLQGMKGKVAINNGATFDINGATVNGTNQIDTQFIPANDFTDGNNAIHSFVKDALLLTGDALIIPNIAPNFEQRITPANAGISSWFRFRQQYSVSILNGGSDVLVPNPQLFTGGNWGNRRRPYINGVAGPTGGGSQSVIGASTNAILLGGGTEPFAIQAITFSVGEGFDIVTHYTNVRALLTDLGTLP